MLSQINRCDAVLFDLDGTLANSEPQTAQAISLVMKEKGVADAWLPTEFTSGCTWTSIVSTLQKKYELPSPSWIGVEARLAEVWEQLVVVDVCEIPGAIHAVQTSHQYLPIGVVSSTPLPTVNQMIESLGVTSCIPIKARVGGGDVSVSKPSPEGYLLAARRLEVDAKHCLVFEDSIAGVKAAKAAGATCFVILHACSDIERCCALADGAILNFQELPTDFWSQLVPSVS